MICQECQSKEANMHLTKIVNGEKIEVHLCNDCASQYQKEWNEMFEPFSINKFLANILQPDLSITNRPSSNLRIDQCEKCSHTYSDFSETGKVGCANCYDIFGSILTPLVRRVHGAKAHKGKVPKRIGGNILLRRELDDLKYKLNDLIRKEEFEEAAKVRDKIKEVEKELNS